MDAAANETMQFNAVSLCLFCFVQFVFSRWRDGIVCERERISPAFSLFALCDSKCDMVFV
jgi:hypothetical protein